MKTATSAARPARDESTGKVISFPDVTPSTVSVPLETGGTVDVEAGRRVLIRAPDGDVQLAVEATDRGPVLRVAAVEIEMEASEDIRVSCRNFVVDAAEDIRHEAEGSVKIQAGQELETEAADTRIRSNRGDVEVSANDDVRMKGERIKLNC